MQNAVPSTTYYFDPNQNQSGLRIQSSENKSLRSLPQNISINQALTDFDDGELCTIHRGEPMIAIDDADLQKYGCNKCVFERQLQRPRFLAHSAKQTKKRVDKCYE